MAEPIADYFSQQIVGWDLTSNFYFKDTQYQEPQNRIKAYSFIPGYSKSQEVWYGETSRYVVHKKKDTLKWPTISELQGEGIPHADQPIALHQAIPWYYWVTVIVPLLSFVLYSIRIAQNKLLQLCDWLDIRLENNNNNNDNDKNLNSKSAVVFKVILFALLTVLEFPAYLATKTAEFFSIRAI